MSPSEYQDLVAFLGERFAGIDRRFEIIDRRFDGIDRRFEGMERRLDGMERRFEGMERRFEGLHEEFAQLRDDMLRHFDQLYLRLERLEGEYQAIIQALRRIEARLADEQGRREILERDLATLRDNVAVLGARIDEIERRLES